MRSYFLSYLENFWNLLGSIAPYILVGIFLAGSLKLLIKEEWIRRHMGGSSLGSSLKSILLGIPLPLCSCSVIPFATALRKAGASRSSTLSFLISSPITGVDSIAATYGVLGGFFTFYRIVSSIFIALLASVLSMIFDQEAKEKKRDTSRTFSLSPMLATEGKIASMPKGNQAFSSIPVTQTTRRNPQELCEESSCGCGESTSEMETSQETRSASAISSALNWIQKLWKQSVEVIFRDFVKALLLGIALGALLLTLMPDSMSAYLGENLWINYLLILVISAPLYICATSSIPLGVALLASGFSPGAVFVFLTAGPATSTVTMSVVKKILGTRSLILYLIAVITGTLAFALLFDTVFLQQAVAVREMIKNPETPGFLGQISAVILLILAWKILFPKKSQGCCGG